MDDKYYYKQQYANRVMRENAEIGQENGLTEEQTDYLEKLASFRHKLHTSQKQIFGENDAYLAEEIDMDSENTPLRDEGYKLFGKYPFKTKEMAYASLCSNDSDDVNALYTYEDGEKLVNDSIEEVNDEIEKFLSSIDEKYKTHYSPTGIARAVNYGIEVVEKQPKIPSMKLPSQSFLNRMSR